MFVLFMFYQNTQIYIYSPLNEAILRDYIVHCVPQHGVKHSCATYMYNVLNVIEIIY